MFRAVRSWFGHARHQRTIRLFLFELTVVMIGVLAAQQVQNWAQNRSALQQVEGVHRSLFHAFGIYRAIAQADLVALPCLSARVQTILQRASSRGAIDERLLSAAPVLGISEDIVSAENDRLLRQRYGETVTDQMMSVEFGVRLAGEAGSDLDRRWFELQRLNPKYGPVTDYDRSAARASAVQILSDIARRQREAGSIIDLTKQLGIAASGAIRPVSSCARMWDQGRGFEGH